MNSLLLVFGLPVLLLGLFYCFVEHSRKKEAVKEGVLIEELRSKISSLELRSFTVSDRGQRHFETSKINVGPFRAKASHDMHLGGIRFGDKQQLVGKIFFRNMYSESLDDLKDRMEMEGYFPANLREVMSWSLANAHFMRGEDLYFMVAPEGKTFTANGGRFVFTQYPGVFWDPTKSTWMCAYASAATDVLYLGVKPA